ncbi:MAG: GNAT family N-acetyltransferase [Armatimonadetes bacterium]|nr:GNAT family N-acetyltransferase [Armatimonadota bacterium]
MPVTPTISDLLRLQRAYYEAISTWERRPWGAIGLNVHNPDSHDSNHAYIDRQVDASDLVEILRHVATFYGTKGIGPRVRYHIPPNSEGLEEHAQAVGWSVHIEGETWRAWPMEDGYETAPEVTGLTLSLAGSGEREELLAVCNEGLEESAAHRHARVWTALLASDAVDSLIARVEGEPAAELACVWRDGWGSIEHVETRESHRRRGVCTAMIRFMQAVAVSRGENGLYLYDTIYNADRIYAREGFRLVARPHQVHLWLEGR